MFAKERAAQAEEFARPPPRRSEGRKIVRGTRGRRIVVSLFLAMTVVLAVGFLFFVRQVESDEPSFTGHAEGVVALTGGADRISDAIDLLARGHADRLLITGVNQSTTAASIARLTPQYRGLFSCCIDLGYVASNTVGNATETREWVARHRIRSVIVVTSNYHMPRALVEMGHELPGVRLVAHSVISDRQRSGPWWTDTTMVRLLAFEYIKYLEALARTSIAAGAPSGAPRRLDTVRRT